MSSKKEEDSKDTKSPEATSQQGSDEEKDSLFSEEERGRSAEK